MSNQDTLVGHLPLSSAEFSTLSDEASWARLQDVGFLVVLGQGPEHLTIGSTIFHCLAATLAKNYDFAVLDVALVQRAVEYDDANR